MRNILNFCGYTPRVDYRDKIDMIILVEADAVRIIKSKEAAL